MFRYFRHHFFNQLMLFNTLIVCTASLLFGVIAHKSLSKVQTVYQLRAYESSLIRLHEIYNAKQEDYTDLMLTFYEESENLQAVSLLLESEAERLDQLPALSIQMMTRSLKHLCNKDTDIEAIYIYKRKGDHLYEYRVSSNVIREISRDFFFYGQMKNKSFDRSIYGIYNINYGESPSEPLYVYSIGGNLSTDVRSIHERPGNILIAYNELELQRSLFNNGLHRDSRFVICRDSGEIIFDSQKNYNGKSGMSLVDFDPALIQGNGGEITLKGEAYYYSVLRDTKRGYFSFYLAPREAIKSGQRLTLYTVWGWSLVFVGLSILLFIFFTRWSTNRFAVLEKGITQIGLSNLSYRIPMPRRQDEFAFITGRFNRMCDDLEETINMAYRYELQQKNAELYALQTSINPHFLYNTLEVIRNRMIMGHSGDASEMILLLSKLYRSQMKGRIFISLREEINSCQLFVDLYSMRHQDRLVMVNRIGPEILRFAVPKHCLQPLIENFIVHGLKESGNVIELDAVREEDRISLFIRDNGDPVDEEKLEEIKRNLLSPREYPAQGSGLRNVHNRFRIVFGRDMGMSVGPGPGGGIQIELRMLARSIEELEERYKKAQEGQSDEESLHR